MAYRLDLINRSGLFSAYASWYEDDNHFNTAHNSIIFRISTIICSIEKIHILSSECMEQFSLFEKELKVDIEVTNINFQSPSIFEILINLSNSLSSLRILQNNLLAIIYNIEKANKNNTQLPNSMNDFIKKIDSYSIKETVKNIIKQYWNNNGMILKDYRDIDQHFDFIFKKIYINRDDKELLIFLPDNPNTKSEKNFTFNLRRDAIKFIIDQFIALEVLFDSVAEEYGYKNRDGFDFTVKVDKQDCNTLSIVFDPHQNYLIGFETFTHGDCISNAQYVAEVELSKYSFIKKPIYFDNKHTFVQFF